MATYWVSYCDGATGTATNISGASYPTCTGNAGWVQVDSPVQSADLDAGRAATAFGAGFVVMATGLVLVFALRVVVRAIRDW